MALKQLPNENVTAFDDLGQEQWVEAPSDKFLAALAAQAFEATRGTRTVAQLAAHITIDVAQQLAMVRAAYQERNQMFGAPRYIVPRPGHVTVSRTQNAVLHVAVVLHTAQRAHAVSMTLERLHGRWRASSLDVM